MLLLYLPAPLPLQQPFEHCRAIQSTPISSPAGRNFLFLEAFAWRGNIFDTHLPG